MSHPIGPISRIAIAIRDGDFAAIAEHLRRTGVVVASDDLGRLCRDLAPPVYHDDDIVMCWLLSRLARSTHGCRDPMLHARLTVRLNIGFVAVAETDAQIARLREEGAPSAVLVVARSKVSHTTQVIRPIDVTAARVARQTHSGDET